MKIVQMSCTTSYKNALKEVEKNMAVWEEKMRTYCWRACPCGILGGAGKWLCN